MQAPAQRPSLVDLHDIVVPEAVSWMPATTAWYVLAAAIVAGLVWAAVVSHRRYQANRYRREALARMDAIDAALADPARRAEAIGELPGLTKQVALAFSPRSEIAGLSGNPWLAYLDTTCEGDSFSGGPGQLLPAIAYGSEESRPQIPSAELDALTALLRAWIKGHHVRV